MRNWQVFPKPVTYLQCVLSSIDSICAFLIVLLNQKLLHKCFNINVGSFIFQEVFMLFQSLACRQKTRNVTDHMKIIPMHWNFMNTILYTICQLFDTYIHVLTLYISPSKYTTDCNICSLSANRSLPLVPFH